MAPALPFITAALGGVAAFSSYKAGKEQKKALEAQEEEARLAQEEQEALALKEEKAAALKVKEGQKRLIKGASRGGLLYGSELGVEEKTQALGV